MATVDGLTATAMAAIRDNAIVGGTVDAFGHLILTRHNGTTFDAGAVFGGVPDATSAIKGIVELATNAETLTGTDSTRAVTPAGMASVNGIGLGYRLVQTIKVTVSTTFTKSSYPNLRAARIRSVGGGGGGGGGAATSSTQHTQGGGGGGGGYAEKWLLDADIPGTAITLTIGAAGVGSSGANGSSGGTTSFGTLCQASGGAGGQASTPSGLLVAGIGGVGGVGTIGDVLASGSPGHMGLGNATLAIGGPGGSSIFGGGAIGMYDGTGAASFAGNNAPAGYGGGGGGAAVNANAVARAGGSGTPGLILVDIYV
jgi:hypothetical protein